MRDDEDDREDHPETRRTVYALSLQVVTCEI